MAELRRRRRRTAGDHNATALGDARPGPDVRPTDS